MRSRSRARANIALIKYWGKSDPKLNTPAVGSISITLDRLWSDTEVAFDESLAADRLDLNGAEDPEALARVTGCLDLVRERAGVSTRATITTRNNFPTSAGLASSASGFAALVHAAASGLGLKLSDEELSKLARRGSGSAARSIFGGFVEMRAGGGDCDGADSFATPILAAREWPLSVVIAITDVGAKSVGSSRGMQTSAETSPYYARWIDASGEDLGSARAAIAGRDFAALAALSEHSCLKMHAVAMAGKPPLIYWNAATLSCIAAVRELQREGAPVFFTIDAGPQVKAVCLPEAEQRVATALRGLPGVLDIIVTGLGPGVQSL